MIRELSTLEICVYLRLLRESLQLNESFLRNDWPTFDEQFVFWARYVDANDFCNLENTADGINLLIDRLEQKR
jgi:hypothetical protein